MPSLRTQYPFAPISERLFYGPQRIAEREFSRRKECCSYLFHSLSDVRRDATPLLPDGEEGIMRGWIIPPSKAPTKSGEALSKEREEKARWLLAQGYLRSERITNALLWCVKKVSAVSPGRLSARCSTFRCEDNTA